MPKSSTERWRYEAPRRDKPTYYVRLAREAPFIANTTVLLGDSGEKPKTRPRALRSSLDDAAVGQFSSLTSVYGTKGHGETMSSSERFFRPARLPPSRAVSVVWSSFICTTSRSQWRRKRIPGRFSRRRGRRRREISRPFLRFSHSRPPLARPGFVTGEGSEFMRVGVITSAELSQTGV